MKNVTCGVKSLFGNSDQLHCIVMMGEGSEMTALFPAFSLKTNGIKIQCSGRLI